MDSSFGFLPSYCKDVLMATLEFNFPTPLPFGKINELTPDLAYNITRHEVYDTQYGKTIVVDLNNEKRYNLPQRYCKQLLANPALFNKFFNEASILYFRGMSNLGTFSFAKLEFICT